MPRGREELTQFQYVLLCSAILSALKARWHFDACISRDNFYFLYSEGWLCNTSLAKNPLRSKTLESSAQFFNYS